MMKKIFGILLALSVCASCSPNENTSKISIPYNKLQVGVILPTRDVPRWTKEEAYFEKMFTEKG
ncbi:hypothetical protein FACS1894188_08210 [Clostridia bacterium]|nr:hypothetical protein FACS1894188_08210 [Clostridia bacterium]